MCCGAGAKAPVHSGWAPAVGQDSPGGIHEVRMGLGQGVKKDVDRDGPGQPLVQPRMGLALLCQGAPAGKGAARACLRAGAGRGANQRVFRRQSPPARNSQTRGALLAHSSSSLLLLLAAYVSRHASGKPRGTEASRLGLGSQHCGRGRWQKRREKRQGSDGLLLGAAVSHESGPIPHRASPDLCLPPSPFWAVWLPEVLRSSANTALYLVAFYISFLRLSCSGCPAVIISFFSHCRLPSFLGKLQF